MAKFNACVRKDLSHSASWGGALLPESTDFGGRYIGEKLGPQRLSCQGELQSLPTVWQELVNNDCASTTPLTPEFGFKNRVRVARYAAHPASGSSGGGATYSNLWMTVGSSTYPAAWDGSALVPSDGDPDVQGWDSECWRTVAMALPLVGLDSCSLSWTQEMYINTSPGKVSPSSCANGSCGPVVGAVQYAQRQVRQDIVITDVRQGEVEYTFRASRGPGERGEVTGLTTGMDCDQAYEAMMEK
jgi:hypothetical protein